MFKLRYNILALTQVLIIFFNAIFLIKLFGTSVEADAFLLSSSIIASLNLVQLLFVEQFIYFYNDLKVKDRKDAEHFFQSSFVFALIMGIVFCLINFFSSIIVIKLFAFNLDEQRFNTTMKVFSVSTLSLIFMGVNHILRGKLNAEGYFSLPYILSTIPHFFILSTLIWCFISGDASIVRVAYAMAIGSIIQFVLSIAVVNILGFRTQPSIWHPLMKKFITNSFSMRFGHNIHNFFFPLIVNNILSFFPAGCVSSFYYAQRLVSATSSIAIGPSQNVFFAKVSESWSKDNMQEIKLQIKQFLKSIVFLYILITLSISYMIPFILPILAPNDLSDATTKLIKNLFILLALWQIIIIIESAFVVVGISSKNSKLFIMVNSFFIVLFSLMTITFKEYLGIYSIPVAAFFAQIGSCTIYTLFAMMLLNVERLKVLHNPLIFLKHDERKK